MASSAHNPAFAQIQLPKTVIFVLPEGGVIGAKAALSNYLVSLSSRATFPEVCKYSYVPPYSSAVLTPFSDSRQFH